MSAAFASALTRLNQAVLVHLSDDVPVTLNSVVVSAIFDNGYVQGAVGMLGMAGTQPALTLSTTDVPATPVGLPVMVGAASYLVAAHEPDGTGISRLLLESAA